MFTINDDPRQVMARLSDSAGVKDSRGGEPGSKSRFVCFECVEERMCCHLRERVRVVGTNKSEMR